MTDQTAPTPTQFRRGDTVRWPEVDYAMYVTHVDGDKITTDAWAEIPAGDLTLVEPVEDKYDALNEQIAITRKGAPLMTAPTPEQMHEAAERLFAIDCDDPAISEAIYVLRTVADARTTL